MRRFQRVYSLILHSSILNEWEKIWEISFSSSLDEQTIKSAIFILNPRWASNAGSRRNI